jgi:hypothetical protein
MTLDVDMVYTEVVAFNATYNFIVDNFVSNIFYQRLTYPF